jgi:hypothetical protein
VRRARVWIASASTRSSRPSTSCLIPMASVSGNSTANSSPP